MAVRHIRLVIKHGLPTTMLINAVDAAGGFQLQS